MPCGVCVCLHVPWQYKMTICRADEIDTFLPLHCQNMVIVNILSFGKYIT
jgi:hypothetical protein